MRSSKAVLALVAGMGTGFGVHGAWGAAFIPGDLVVYRVGTGTAALSNASAAVFLDEYTVAGTLVQSIALDATGATAVTASGSASSEGLLELSTDGKTLLVTGYNTNAGVGSVAASTAANVQRAVASYGSGGTVTALTLLGAGAFSGNNIRSATSVDGSAIYATGANGVVLAASGSGTSVQIGSLNSRAAGIAAGQLYVSSSSGTGTKGIDAIGSGLPTSGPNAPVRLAGMTDTTSASPYSFAFADLSPTVAGLDTLYISDDGSQASGGGVQKWTFDGTNWGLTGTVYIANVRGLTLSVSGSVVSLYVTGSSTTVNVLDSLVDVSGYGGTLAGTPVVLSTGATNTVYRGVAFVPSAAVLPEPASACLLAPASLLLARRRR